VITSLPTPGVFVELSPPLCASGATSLITKFFPLILVGSGIRALGDEDLANDVRLRLQFKDRIPIRRTKPVALLHGQTEILCDFKIDWLVILYGCVLNIPSWFVRTGLLLSSIFSPSPVLHFRVAL
jgi:hypothetical protein